MLLGLVAKNSILLVESAIVSIREGMSRRDALIEAGRKRAQPDRDDQYCDDRGYDADCDGPWCRHRFSIADGRRGCRWSDNVDSFKFGLHPGRLCDRG